MSSLTIHDMDPDLTEKITRRAARYGRSPEEEALWLLKDALKDSRRMADAHSEDGEPPRAQDAENIYEAIRRHIEPIGGVELELPKREPMREPPRFD